MKIGLIGNMNNNNFAMMRYFVDLGADAHLLLYANDGRGSLSHFAPEADTWDVGRWSPRIHQTSIPNAPIAAFDCPLSSAYGLWSRLCELTGSQASSAGPVSRSQLRYTIRGYDCLIASGISPAALRRIGRALDIFYPCSMGVEFLGSAEFTSSARGSLPRRLLYELLSRRQAHGVASARRVISTDSELTGGVLSHHGIAGLQLTVPMVYNRETLPTAPPTTSLARASHEAAQAGLSVLHHARLMWKQPAKYSDAEHFASTKNSDWLIRAFAELAAARPSVSPRLFLVEYGPDVDASKRLVAQLGIQGAVTWLQKMSRRDIMWLLARVSIGVGEFMNSKSMIWGGTGWETLAAGKPLLQGFRFDEGEFERYYGFPPPPMLPVRARRDVLDHLMFVADHPEIAAAIGRDAQEWFDTHNGISLAAKWLTLATKQREPTQAPANAHR